MNKTSIIWDEKYHTWSVYGYDQARELLKNPHISSNTIDLLRHTTFPSKARKDVEPLLEYFKAWLFFGDPPYHDHLRKILNPFFTPARIKAFRPKIAGFVGDLIASNKSEIDVVADIAQPLPIRIMANLLSLPQEDWRKFAKWHDALVPFMGELFRTPEIYKPALNALQEQREYLQLFVKQRQSIKQDGIYHEVFSLVETNKYIELENLWLILAMLLGTGSQTTSHLLSNGLYLLLKHPAQLKLLRNQPELITNAVQEILRYEPPVRSMIRRAKENIKIGQTAIKKDQYIRIFIDKANRDPSHFDNPNKFDIKRKSINHLSFGMGIHYCLGNLLASNIAEIFFKLFLEKYSDVELAATKVEWLDSVTFRGIKELKVSIKQK